MIFFYKKQEGKKPSLEEFLNKKLAIFLKGASKGRKSEMLKNIKKHYNSTLQFRLYSCLNV